jgi:hypothetical protein
MVWISYSKYKPPYNLQQHVALVGQKIFGSWKISFVAISKKSWFLIGHQNFATSIVATIQFFSY